MASQKQRRKAARRAQKQRRPQTGPFVRADGDRRRRGEGSRVEEAYARKRLMQKGLLPPERTEPEA